MADNDKNDLDEIQEEQHKQIFQIYQDKAKSFQKNFNIICFLSLAFLFIILIPYVSIKTKRSENLKLIHEHSEKIIKLEKRSESIKSIIDGYNIAYKKLINGPKELREFIRDISEQSFVSYNQNAPGGAQIAAQFANPPPQPCDGLEGQDKLECLVNQHVEDMFIEVRDILNRKFIEPLKTIDDEMTEYIIIDVIKKGVEDLHDKYKNILDENPEFWRNYSGKETFYYELSDSLKLLWSESCSDIEKKFTELNEEQTNLKDEINSFEKKQKDLESEQNQIESRLSQVELPLGKLPIGLIESVAVFPVLIAIGFAICTSGMLQTLRLRRVFHTIYQQKDPSRTKITDNHIALIAPLWIDPIGHNQNQIIRLILILLPFIVFVISTWLVLYSWTLKDPLTSTDMPNFWLYSGLYLLSLLVFVYSYWRIFIQYRHYVKE